MTMTPDPFQADGLLYERGLRRRLLRWRIAAVLAVVLAGMVVISQAVETGRDHVARVQIEGFIGDSHERLDLMEAIARDDSARALILRINSPGGSSAGAEALFESVRAVAGKKPVVAVMGEVAASGGYITALAADHIIARRNTITGSIGVLFQWVEIAELMDKAGVAAPAVRSGALKARPNPFESAPGPARDVIRAAVEDGFDWFVDLVARRRAMERTQVLDLADGRIFTGGQARARGLIDDVGGEKLARRWLEEEHEIPADLRVYDRDADSFGAFSALRDARTALAMLAGALAPSGLPGTGGLMAVWRPGG